MKFGIAVPSYGPGDLPANMLQVAQAAEDLGFDSLWTTDHVLVPQQYGPVFGRTLEPVATLAYLAAVTSQVRLGTSVVILPQRDPILLAKQMAAADQLSNGRTMLGVGVGWMKEQYRWLRADFERRGQMADEWIRVMRDLWTNDPSNFAGDFVQYEDAYFEPKPIQPGGPPIYVGGASISALRRAAMLADGWHASGLPLEQFKSNAASLRAMAGDRPMMVSLRAYVAIGPVAERFHDDQDLLIKGQAAEFAEYLNRYGEAGLDEVVLRFAYESIGDAIDQMELFANTVIPEFHSSAGP